MGSGLHPGAAFLAACLTLTSLWAGPVQTPSLRPKQEIRAIAFSPDGSRLAVSAWNEFDVGALVFSPDGRLLTAADG